MEKKEIIIMGGLGVSPRRDRDVDRILHRWGAYYAIPAHVYRDKPMVIRRWKKDK